MTQAARYVSRPVRVLAIQWTGDNLREIQAFVWPASPFYAPAVMGHPLIETPPRLQVRVRDEVAEEKFPSLGPQWKEVDVPLTAWLVQRVDDGRREITVLTDRRFTETFERLAQVNVARLIGERAPAVDDQGSTIDR